MQDKTMADNDVLTGSRVILRPPTLDDAEVLFKRIACDPAVTRYLSWRTHPDINETRRVLTALFNVGQEHTRLIELRDSGDMVGLCGWRMLSPHTVEIGYCIARRWWGQRLTPEVVSILLDEVGRDPAVYRVSAMCHVDNTRSARVLQRCGLSLEGRLVRYCVFPNLSAEPQDVLLYGKAVR
jgi:ribosomal-protein-alanine N-acetyltransferase